MIMSDEKWIVIKGFKRVKDDEYLISNHGRVRRISDGSYPTTKVANKSRHPYRAVYLLQNTGKSKWVLVHQLVATFFVKVPDELIGHLDLVPDHLDNNGLNNYYKNLEWKTRGQNVSDAFKMGFINNSGENHRDTFITEEQAMAICRCLCDNMTYDEIIAFMEFPDTDKYRKLIVRIKNGLAWKEVASRYDFDRKVIQYTPAQRDTIKRIPMIQELLSQGKSTREICNIVYSDCPKDKQYLKMSIIRSIKKKEIFKELL